MIGDFSRETFDQKRHARRVLMQQGRPEIDADGNEQIAVDEHIETATTYDVIGPSGVPLALLPDGTPAGGFAIALNANSSDLTISAGRMYVEGVLVENDAATTLLQQPDRPFSAGTTLAKLADLQGNGTYVVYLDVWEREITALDDQLIRETALGGPDHSIRSRVTWQVDLALVNAGGAAPTCDSIGDTWRPKRPNQGLLAALTGPPPVDQLPCILPPETGYRRLENQFYLVEIHQPGTFGTATFKWSRENGSVIAGVVAPPGPNPPTSIKGPTFNVTTVGRDDSLSFKPGDWVELYDDRSVLLADHGELLQVLLVDPALLTITTKLAATTPVDLALHPQLRRWDQVGDGLGSGIVIADGTPIELEDGVLVQFSNGHFYQRDRWHFPARTKTSLQSGHIEWPLDAAGNPLSLPPRAVVHHYAKLALVAFDGNQFQPINGQVPDCRPWFPPLTQLSPGQPACCTCTITVAPGPGWEKPILAWFKDKNAAINGEICFPIGEYPVTAPIIIATRGDVKVSGSGFGTQLAGSTLESILRFEGCASVIVRDIAAATAFNETKDSPGPKNINGTLEFSNCGEVSVDTVLLRCGTGVIRGAACLAVTNDILPANLATGVGTVRIRNSRFLVGDMQFGILLVHVARATVDDNEITVDASRLKPIDINARLKDTRFLAMARSVLLSHMTVAAAAAPAAPSAPTATAVQPTAPAPRAARRTRRAAGADAAAQPPAPQPGAPVAALTTGVLAAATMLDKAAITVNVGNRAVTFSSNPGLQSTWQMFLDQNAPAAFATDRDLLKFMRASATRILTDPTARTNLAGFQDILRFLQQDVPVLARGIAVGGRAVKDLHIRDNSISAALQGITVGVSHREKAPPKAADRAGSVKICGNVIGVTLNILSARTARHAIFIGNVDSLQIDDNMATLQAPHNFEWHTDGIRVFGYLGKKMIIRNNHLARFSPGIFVQALSAPGKAIKIPQPYELPTRHGNLWLIADNAFEGAGIPIDAPACAQVDNVS